MTQRQSKIRLATAREELRFAGLPVSEGIVMAPAFFVEHVNHKLVPYYPIAEVGVEAEKQRLSAALDAAAAQLVELIAQVTERIGPAQANIFLAQKLMIEDPVLVAEMNDFLEQERLNAETAVERTLDSYEARLMEVDDDYIKERASDIGEIRRRLLELLRTGGVTNQDFWQRQPAEKQPHIVVAEELTPSETVALDPQLTAGFITERGGATSHVAILARALGIPAVSGIKNLREHLSHGELALLNGHTGEVILWPGQSTLELFALASRDVPQEPEVIGPVEGARVMANISLAGEAKQLSAVRAEGIGLYRTEYEFFTAGKLLSEEEQYQRYAEVVTAMQGQPVHIRLLDFGGDKACEFLNLPREENPCLGFRGSRLLQGRPELLRSQARAIARASIHGPVHVIYPMIVEREQFVLLREIFRDSVRDLRCGELHHGVMFEVPSACLAAEELLELADFGSIGSNDLIQYLFAIDRNNDLVASDYNPDRKVFWRLLDQLVKTAGKLGKPLSICGEMAGQPQYIPRLLQLGLVQLSVSPRLVRSARLAAHQFLYEHRI